MLGIKETGNQKTANEGHVEQLPSVQQKHAAFGTRSKKRALERRGTKEHTVPGMAGGQQRSLVSNEEDWGKEEENPHEGRYGKTTRESLAEASSGCRSLETRISSVWAANGCIK